MGSVNALEFGFDADVPAKDRVLIRSLMPANAVEIRRVKWNTPGIVLFRWIHGGNVNFPTAFPTFPNPAVSDEINRGLYCIAWIYRSANVSININAAYVWKKNDLRSVLEHEISRAIH